MTHLVPAAGSGHPASSAIAWPVRSGIVPPLAEGFVARLESAPGFEAALAKGCTVVLSPASHAPEPGSPDWLGACGKTQLAAHVAESLWQSGDLDLLVWVNATTEASVLSGYAAAAVAAVGVDPGGDAESLATRFVSWLAHTSRSWLVVLDGLISSLTMNGLWPAGPGGRVLVTAAESVSIVGQDAVVSFPINVLSRREALTYLLRRLSEDRGQRTGAIDLVDRLGGEPLALSQISAVIEGSSLSCREYLEHYARKHSQLSAHGAPLPAAAVTWTLCVEQAYRLLPGGATQPLLVLAALLDGSAIPGTTFTSAAAREFAGGIASGVEQPEEAWEAMLSLASTGLLSIDQAESPPLVRINSAIQAAIRSATSGQILDQAALAAARALVEAWPGDDADAWLSDSLRACAQSVMRFARDTLWTAGCYQLLFRLGQSLENARLIRLAAAHWSDVAAASERHLGPGHPDTLMAVDRLAATFMTAGRAADAVPWFQRVLAERSAHLGPENPATIASAARLGRALHAAGRTAEAVGVLERAVSDSAHALGAGHLDTLYAREALAASYCAAGQEADGIRQYQRTIADRERVQGAVHPATMAACTSLGDAFLAADRIKEALAQYKRVITGLERTHGGDHPDTIAARGRLASAYRSAGRMATALQLYEQARSDSERVLGVDHPDTLARRVNLAHAYYSVGRIGDAITLLRDTAQRCDRVLAPQDPVARIVRESLTNIAGD